MYLYLDQKNLHSDHFYNFHIFRGSRNSSYVRGADIIYYRIHLAKYKNRTDLIYSKFKYNTALINISLFLIHINFIETASHMICPDIVNPNKLPFLI